MEQAPDAIATANIGCQMHLGAAAGVPVLHWVELLRWLPAAHPCGAWDRLGCHLLLGSGRRRELQALMEQVPDAIATANIGCQMHLGAAAGVPVLHWVELLRWLPAVPHAGAGPAGLPCPAWLREAPKAGVAKASAIRRRGAMADALLRAVAAHLRRQGASGGKTRWGMPSFGIPPFPRCRVDARHGA